AGGFCPPGSQCPVVAVVRPPSGCTFSARVLPGTLPDAIAHASLRGSRRPVRVLFPRDAVDTRRCVFLQCEKRRAESVDIDVVEKRGEPHHLVRCRDLTYTVERIWRASPA